jgi:FkbM family methyltransferase
MLEACFGWHGVLVEGHPAHFAALNASSRMRRAVGLHSAVCNSTQGERTLQFSLDGSSSAGVLADLSPKKQHARRRRTVAVPCQRLDSLMVAGGLRRGATLLSLDVEGGEHTVLSASNPELFRIVMVEMLSSAAKNARVRQLLVDRGLVPAKHLLVYDNEVFVQPDFIELPLPGPIRHAQAQHKPATYDPAIVPLGTLRQALADARRRADAGRGAGDE